MDDLTEQGIQAFRAGERDRARKLLSDAIKQNPNSERAWGWLSNIMETDKDRIYCLKQVLRINPNNEKANQLLRNLTGKQSQIENQPTPRPVQVTQKQSVMKKNSSNAKRTPLILVGGIASIALCLCGFFVIGLFLNSSNEVTAKVLSAEAVFEAWLYQSRLTE